LCNRGRHEEAVEYLKSAIGLRSENPNFHFDLAVTLELLGQPDRAVEYYRNAIRLGAENFRHHCALAHACRTVGDTAAAERHYGEAMRLEPNWPNVVDKKVWWLAVPPDPRRRNGPAAVLLGEQVCQATGYTHPEFLDTLAAAYAEVARFIEAVELARKAAD